jgi:hypothetical protein
MRECGYKLIATLYEYSSILIYHTLASEFPYPLGRVENYPPSPPIFDRLVRHKQRRDCYDLHMFTANTICTGQGGHMMNKNGLSAAAMLRHTWDADKRWQGVERPYTARPVCSCQGGMRGCSAGRWVCVCWRRATRACCVLFLSGGQWQHSACDPESGWLYGEFTYTPMLGRLWRMRAGTFPQTTAHVTVADTACCYAVRGAHNIARI